MACSNPGSMYKLHLMLESLGAFMAYYPSVLRSRVKLTMINTCFAHKPTHLSTVSLGHFYPAYWIHSLEKAKKKTCDMYYIFAGSFFMGDQLPHSRNSRLVNCFMSGSWVWDHDFYCGI